MEIRVNVAGGILLINITFLKRVILGVSYTQNRKVALYQENLSKQCWHLLH